MNFLAALETRKPAQRSPALDSVFRAYWMSIHIRQGSQR